jgi:hypothetical protein
MASGNDSPNPSNKLSAISRAAMWLGGSALFGSLALVLWNRRALRSMHEAPDVPEAPVMPSDNEIY